MAAYLIAFVALKHMGMVVIPDITIKLKKDRREEEEQAYETEGKDEEATTRKSNKYHRSRRTLAFINWTCCCV